uniref:ATPase F1/V1/A1 complex alpha/beta subunit nucleotide-binding domain-containing protein n=1 Tax=Lotharella globosa TaxID=91324 RepID=A0A7S4E079_9EUKA
MSNRRTYLATPSKSIVRGGYRSRTALDRFSAKGVLATRGRRCRRHSHVVNRYAPRATLESDAKVADDIAEAARPTEEFSIGNMWTRKGNLLVVNGTLDLVGRQGSIIELDGGARAIFLWERAALYYAYLLPGSPEPVPGAEAFLSETRWSMDVGEGLAGKTVDMLGRVIGETLEGKTESQTIFNAGPAQNDLQTIRRSLLTGVTAIDSLAPMGMGQNMLIIGHERTGKTSLAVNSVLAQRDTDVKVVYAALDGNGEEVQEMLRAGGAMEYATVVVPDYEGAHQPEPEEEAARQLIAASTAVAIGEHIRKEGGEVLVVLDSLSGYQNVWKYVCEKMLDAGGGLNVFQGADDSAMRQFYSALFQRVGKYNRENGGGSLSMMMVLPTHPPPAAEDRDFELSDFEGEMVNDYTRNRLRLLADKGVKITREVLAKLDIPAPGTRTVETLAWIQDTDALVSLSDGHIVLDAKEFEAGRRPAVDPSNSLTRVGIGSGAVQGRAFAPVIQKVTPRLRLDIAQMVKQRIVFISSLFVFLE